MTKNFKLILGAEIVVALVVVLVAVSGSRSETAQPTPTPTPTLTQETDLIETCMSKIEARSISQTWSRPPELDLEDNRKYWELQTNCGQVVIEAFKDKAPIAINSLRFLTDEKYFDGSPCHRLTTKSFYVIQCGDPTGNGTGSPGYQIMEENLPANSSGNYPAGTVALAKSAQPNTSAAQFFIVYKDTTLSPDYAIVGQIISGLDIIEKIANAGTLGNVADGLPKQNFGILTAEFSGKKPSSE